MAEGLQAGRLDVPVVANLAGFAEKLRTAVETAAEGLAAQVKVEVDSKGLRKRLEKAVEKASRGVTATVRVKVDESRFQAELEALRRRVDDADLRLPVRPDGEGDGGGQSGGLLSRLRGLITGAQGEADRNPVHVPVRMSLPGGGRRSLRMLGIGALISLLQPAVALIGQYGAGLTALVSAATPAVGVLGAIPGLISAAATAAIGTTVAFKGFGEALKQSNAAQQMLAQDGKVTEAQQKKLKEAMDKLSPSAREAVKAVSSLQTEWSEVRMTVSDRFFSEVADDIKPLAKSVFPLLEDALGDSAAQMGSLAERGAKFMQSGPFRKDFKTIASSNSRIVGHMADSLANVGRATMDFLVASGPFAERVARGGERMTQWFRASVKAGRETGSLARFLDHAGDKAAQLGRSTGSLIKGLGGVGKAAMDTGNALVDGLEGSMKRFERWANSGAGQKAMRQFFSDAAPVFTEVNKMFGDLMRGLGRSMRDGGILDLVRQIRTELMPALGAFFDGLGQTIGPALISLISNIATAIGNLAAAGSGLGVLLMAFSGLLQVFNTLMSVVPGANTVLATLLGTMLALKVVSSIAGLIGRFGTSVAAAGTSVRGLGTTMSGTMGPGVMGPQISMWQRMVDTGPPATARP
ncbi:Phage tail protein OS=Streptomyces griseomycini OX=66895 GN=FHS37_006603 PE=4 SV=1 [Streptomyces griseomycini]